MNRNFRLGRDLYFHPPADR